ncbi:MAG: alkaline phosphatase family protein [Steroidobacterales bacterium]
MRAWRRVAATLLLLAAAQGAQAASVVMISVDGMKPEYVLQADAHGLNLPYLRSLVASGSYALGVVGVWPTITYPSHTTLVTGVAPSVHGIYANLEFDPMHDRQEPWFWYAGQIRSPTLWQALHAAHRVTASIGWPATVGADIDYLIPEYWRITGKSQDLNPSDRYLIAALSRPYGLIAELQPAAGPYMMANDNSLDGDAIKTRYAVGILRRHHLAFMTVHLSSLDDAEHSFGPFSAAANADLEALDPMIAQIAAAAHAADHTAIVVVVSDHGFSPVSQRLNLAVPFVQAGLIEVAEDPASHSARVKSWKAQPWMAGGMAAIMLRDPQDRNLQDLVEQLLRKLAADPRNGIAEIRTREQMQAAGGFPDAAFVVSFSPGFYAGGNFTGPLVTAMAPGHGGHGFAPENPDMRAAFFVSGPGIAGGRDLGIIDMRQIAPTVAALLGVSLPGATAPSLDVRASGRIKH